MRILITAQNGEFIDSVDTWKQTLAGFDGRGRRLSRCCRAHALCGVLSVCAIIRLRRTGRHRPAIRREEAHAGGVYRPSELGRLHAVYRREVKRRFKKV